MIRAIQPPDPPGSEPQRLRQLISELFIAGDIAGLLELADDLRSRGRDEVAIEAIDFAFILADRASRGLH